jgi:hypothetical protein
MGQAVLLTPSLSFRLPQSLSPHLAPLSSSQPRKRRSPVFALTRHSLVLSHVEGSPACPESCRRATRHFSLSLTLLEATLTHPPLNVASKGLTGNLTSLESTFTKNRGEGYPLPQPPRNLYATTRSNTMLYHCFPQPLVQQSLLSGKHLPVSRCLTL